MPPQTDLKARIQNALAQCAHGDLLPNALALFAALGYRSAKQISLPDNTARGFLAEFGDERFNAANALTDEWRSIDLVLQLTDTEINHTAQRSLFDSHGVDRSNYQSYLIFAIELAGATYARTALAKITREVNKLFAMPALILFKYGNTLTLSVIDRRLHKRDEAKDVLEKVTLIKDIRLVNPHRAHIEILFDLALPTLLEQYHPQNFDALHDAWRAVLDTSELNKKFFRALANWFYWAQAHVSFPSGGGKNQAERNATALIRLITRLIFTWFIQEKDLVPPALFDENQARQLLADFAPQRDTYYKAILQNLFFGTLNTEMHARAFRHEPKAGQRADDFMTHNRYRYKSYFANPDAWLALTRDIPFLNGGLFECLDKEVERNGKQELLRVDGFSDHPANELNVPNYLFFADENDPRYYKEKDNAHLNEVFGTKNKKYQVRGLVRLLHRYKFTIDENTPLEQEVALDPELLGKVFENLLAAYNPETGVTARKQTGSFYTPREIVNYMVDEALLAYLETRLQDLTGFQTPASHETAASIQRAREMSSKRDKNLSGLSLDARLRRLFAYTDEPHQFDAAETAALIEAIDNLKLLDPACGSGAFPMGALHKLVLILHKLDPDNARWKAKQIAKASEIPDTTVREKVVADIEQSFNRNELDYGRKLYLIENCIYGVDIQPIAVQIAKLRCFIALIVDEKMDAAKENRGIRPLPNLETKFVAANTLLGLDKPKQMLLRNPAIESKEKELADVRRSLFTARTRETKEKHRKRDAALRKEIGELLKKDGWLPGAANQLATWDPYDQNAHAEFFDAEWMFGVTDGFDVVIGNPPYGASYSATQKDYFQTHYLSAKSIPKVQKGSLDTYSLFVDLGLFRCAKTPAVLSYIVPLAFTSSESMFPLHTEMLKSCTRIAVSSYSNRPNRIFLNADQRVSIVFALKTGTPTKELLTTKIIKRYAETTIDEIINGLEFVNSLKFVKRGRFPKVGTKTELAILEKVFSIPKTLADYEEQNERKQTKRNAVYYRAAGGRYYNIVTNFSTGSTQEKPFFVRDVEADVICALLSSSLYYWLYLLYSDNLHIKSYELLMCPIPFFDVGKSVELKMLYASYIQDLERNAIVKKADYSNVSAIKEYRARLSKPLIDEIDRALQEPFGLSDDEIEFIINYDLKFRTDEED